jgi:PEP-CTERM motif
MKNVFLSFAVLCLLAGGGRAGVMLGTSNPPATPLTMTVGTTSGPMFVNVVSNNAPNDIMAAWQFGLEIVPNAGATGTLTFQDPPTGMAPNPPNYIFGSNGLGIAVPSNTGSSSDPVNDFYSVIGSGVVVPATFSNLLQMDFSASSGASGLFGIYAVEGAANTVWSDPSFTTQFFSNVPDGTGTVLIGDVLVQPAAGVGVPEPSTLALLALGSITLAGWRQRWGEAIQRSLQACTGIRRAIGRTLPRNRNGRGSE